MSDLRGKTVIITGGSRGIGKACCLEFARQGSNVVFTFNKSQKEAESLSSEIKKFGVDCLYLQTDIRDYDQCCLVVEKSIERFKEIDILVNNAGVKKDKALFMMLPEEWKEVIDTNLNGTFNMTKAAIITFLKQKKGSIINMSSVSGLVGLIGQTNYSASKAGIIGFSKALAKEVAAYNIRVNVVCPGFIETDMVSSIREDIKKEVLKMIPLKRIGTPEEVASICTFLASGKAGYITGEVIKVDGGLAI
ncbi:MAG: 3-oxoacyl-[acyl-carrier-protein] reductase [Candidatus Omnitrophota bacterium]|jgi:3-oxoacyl-[acyl-carrier protein] reductase